MYEVQKPKNKNKNPPKRRANGKNKTLEKRWREKNCINYFLSNHCNNTRGSLLGNEGQ